MADDLGLHITVHRILKAGQTFCEVEVANAGTRNRRASALIDRVGERPKLEIQYYTYTSLGHTDRAKYVIDEYRKNLSR